MMMKMGIVVMAIGGGGDSKNGNCYDGNGCWR